MVGFKGYWFMVFGYRDQSCGTLFCTGGWEFPVTSRKSFYKVGNREICNEATLNPEDNYPADLGMVPTGTKCGINMVGKRACVSIDTVKKPSMNYRSVSGVIALTVSLCVSQVCYNQRCQDMANIKVYGMNDCSAKCNNRGVKKKACSPHNTLEQCRAMTA